MIEGFVLILAGAAVMAAVAGLGALIYGWGHKDVMKEAAAIFVLTFFGVLSLVIVAMMVIMIAIGMYRLLFPS